MTFCLFYVAPMLMKIIILFIISDTYVYYIWHLYLLSRLDINDNPDQSDVCIYYTHTHTHRERERERERES